MIAKYQNERSLKFINSINLSESERVFVAFSFQGEGFFSTNYSVRDVLTRLVIGFRITDYDWSIRLSQTLGITMGLEHPAREGFRYVFPIRAIGGKALKITKQIQPFLIGDKAREASTAIKFFSSNGSKKGAYPAKEVFGRVREENDEYNKKQALEMVKWRRRPDSNGRPTG